MWLTASPDKRPGRGALWVAVGQDSRSCNGLAGYRDFRLNPRAWQAVQQEGCVWSHYQGSWLSLTGGKAFCSWGERWFPSMG